MDEPAVTTLMHFTDEIGTVEISTYRDSLTLVLPDDLEVSLVVHHRGQTFIHINKKKGKHAPLHGVS
jgi:hypothetical protein